MNNKIKKIIYILRTDKNGLRKIKKILIRTAKVINLEILKQKVYNKPFGMSRKYELLL